VGGGRPYAILPYICHKGAFNARQTDSGILDSEYHRGKGITSQIVAGRESEEGARGLTI